jgi:hypothetical protein
MSRFPAWIRKQLHHHDQTNVTNAIGPEHEHPTNEHIPNPGELRGIPAIGRGVTGAIPHTRPGDTIR